MKVAYSFPGNLYGPGRGYIAHWGVDELARRGWLACAHNAYYEGEPPRPAWMRNHTGLTLFAKMLRRAAGTLRIPLPADYETLVRDGLFDRLVAWQLPRADAVYGWSGGSLRTFTQARRQGIPCVLENPTSHVALQERILHEEAGRHGIQAPPVSAAVRRRVEREYALADRIVVPSEFAHASLEAEGVPREKLVLLPYGVDTGRFTPAPAEEAAREPFRVLFMGEVGLRKGAVYLLRAWERLDLPGARLSLVGPLRPEIRRLAGDILARPDVEAAGFDYDNAAWYRRSHVFVLPSLEDGYGLVVTEAMASGLPVIVTDRTGARDAVRDGETGFVIASGDVEALADRIRTLFEDQGLRERMGRAALAAAQGLSWAPYAQGVAETLAQAAAARERGR